MTKICLVVVWMGRLNDSFYLWKESVRNNPTIDVYFITDQEEPDDCPDNLFFIKRSLSEVRETFEKRLGMRIWLKSAYKLCDYKPIWWMLIEDRIGSYDFYGHCDVDLIFGDIRHFLTEDFLEKYDKIFDCGYLILYRNTEENKYMFQKSVLKDNMAYPYTKVFKNGFACYFDEFMGMSILSWKYHPGYYDQTTEAYLQDFSWKRLDFNSYITHSSFVFHVKDGKIYEINVDEDGVIVESLSANYLGREMLLAHIQKRDMVIDSKLFEKGGTKDYWIFPNRFSSKMPEGRLYSEEEKKAYAELIEKMDNERRRNNLKRGGIFKYIPHYFITRKIHKFIRTEKGYF